MKFPWRRDGLPSPVFLAFPGGSAGEELACNAGDLGLIPGLGRSPGEGKGYPLQDSGLENSINYIFVCSMKVKVKSLSRVRLLATPWTIAHQALRPWDFPGKSIGVGCHCLLR